MVLCTGLFDLELHYSDVKSPVGRFKDTVTGSPILSMGKEQEMQNTWPCKGKPPVSPNSS